MPLDFDLLSNIEEKLLDIFSEGELLGILSMLNRKGQLKQFLELIGHKELLPGKEEYQITKKGRIIVIGASDVKQSHLEGAAKDLGFEKERFEFYLEYKDGMDKNIRSWQYNPKISAVLVGPMPHSGEVKGDYNSVISAMEQESGYPPVIRLGNNGLKISKASFIEGLKDALDTKTIEF